jgi:hypothetical protein
MRISILFLFTITLLTSCEPKENNYRPVSPIAGGWRQLSQVISGNETTFEANSGTRIGISQDSIYYFMASTYQGAIDYRITSSAELGVPILTSTTQGYEDVVSTYTLNNDTLRLYVLTNNGFNDDNVSIYVKIK